MRYFTPMLIGGCMSLLFAVSAAVPGTVSEAAAAPSPAATSLLAGADAPVVTRLKNGLTVLVAEDPRFPLVSTRLYVHAGSSYEEPQDAGISHVLEHMVFKGTEKRPKGAIAKEVEAAGGYLNAATSFDYTVYLTDMPARHWKLGMDVVHDMAFHSTLEKEELESEKDVIVAELQRGKDSPQSLIFESLTEQTFAKTPYERPIIGFESTIRGLTTERIRAYIDKYYQPQSMLLVVVGDINARAVLAEAETLFGSYDNTASVSPQPLVDATKLHPAAKKIQIQRGAWNKVYLSLALPVPGTNDARTEQLDMLAHLLGGDQTSLFWRRYKYERRLVDSIRVSNLSLERVGLFYITAELDANNIEAFWQALTEDLAKLSASDFKPEELDRARLNIEDDLFRSKETLSGLASKLGFFEFFAGGGVLGEQNTINAIQAVDQSQLQTAIRAWLRPERLNAVILAPNGALLPEPETLEKTLQANWPTQKRDEARIVATQGTTPELIDLGKDRKLVLIPDATLPYISADIAFTGGNSLLEANEQGLAALAARALTKGTARRSATEMQDWLADRAAGLAASASRESFTVSLSSPDRFTDDMFGLLKEILHEPAFEADEIDREKQSQVAAIRTREDQPLGMAFRRLPAFLFPGSVFGYYQLGQENEVLAYTPEAVRAFWKKQSSQPWVLAIAGNFDREAVLKAVQQLPEPNAPTTQLNAPDWASEKALNIAMPGRNQAHYLMLFKTVPIDHADAPALDLLQNILAGQSGLLFRDLRDDKGLGYTVTALNSNGNHFGYLAFYIGTEPEKLSEAEKGFKQVIADLHTTLLSNDEMSRGKNQMEGDYYRERQSLGNRAGEAASLSLFDKPLDFQRKHIGKALTLTPENLRSIARTYIQPETAYTVTVLP